MLRFLNVFVAAWLALALPMGQHEALLHALEHAAGERGAGDQGPAPEKKCEAHSLYTAFAGALASGAPCIPAVAGIAGVLAQARPGIVVCRSSHDYLSRAPPPALAAA